MKYPIIGLTICLFIAGCEKFEPKLPDQNSLTRKSLSEPELTLKENLQKAARIISEIVQDEAVANELGSIANENRTFYNLTFKDLLAETKGTGELFPVLKEKFLDKCSSDESKGPANDLANFLAGKDCYIYCPYPLSFYPKGTNSFTVASHPIDNEYEGKGYRYEGKKLIEVTVNEAYTDKYPVLLIMPRDEDKEDLTGNVKDETSVSKGNPVYEVRIGKVRCADYCGGLFEGTLELRISRGYPDYNATTGAVSGKFASLIPIDYPRDYAKAAINGWTVHSEGGWYNVNIVWDSNWRTTNVLEGILIYEYDHASDISVSTSVGYKINDLSPTISVTAKTTYSGDFLGICEWDRDWFIATNKNPGPYDEVKDGWTIRKTCPAFKLTTPLRIIN